MRFLFGALGALVCSAVSSMAQAPDSALGQPVELAERQSITRKARQLLSINSTPAQLRELDALAHQYRSNKERTPSGIWKLGVLYSAAGNISPPSAPLAEETMTLFSEKTREWAELEPTSPAPHIVQGEILLRSALARAPGDELPGQRASVVERVEQRLAIAKAYLGRNRTVADQDPHWYTLMLRIAKERRDPPETILLLLGEAMQREPHYYPSYFAAMEALLMEAQSPAVLAFLATAAAEATKAEEGLGLYARIYWYAFQLSFGQPGLLFSYHQWETMAKGMADVTARWPDQWNVQYFARFSCLAQDKKRLRELVPAIKGDAIVQVWG